MSKGRPTGTTAAKGFDVSMSGGRPTGTTTAAGFNESGGTPIGTIGARGPKIGLSPGRPKSTTADMGYATGVSGGRNSGAATRGSVEHEQSARTQIMLDAKKNEDEEWCTEEYMVNVPAAKKLKALITKECKFDACLLCWKCGRTLYANVGTGRTWLFQPPTNMTEAEVPASAYLEALPYNNGLTFVHISGKWYSCPTCNRGKTVSTEQHVGDVPANATKKIVLWDM